MAVDQLERMQAENKRPALDFSEAGFMAAVYFDAAG
jgi:hypothetical protein